MSEIDVKGMKFIAVLRCSEEEQVKSSIPQQRTTCQTCAERAGIQIVDEKELPACSATQGDQIEALITIIKRKASGEDFQGILFDSYSRFVRSEVDGSRLYAEICDANLLIYTAKEGLMMGDGSWAKRGAALDQSVGYAKDVSRNVNRGVTDNMVNGLIPACTAFVYGLDRLYSDKDGKKLFLVRRLDDGSKAVLKPDPPYDVLYYIPKGQRRLHLRQSSDHYEFVPGDPAICEIIRDIFTKRFKYGWKFCTIASDLNRRGVKSAKGKYWATTTVEALLENPIYIGHSVGGVRGTGTHSERQRGNPKVLPISRRKERRKNGKGIRKTMKPKIKPPSEWIIVEQPQMYKFLDPEIYVLADAEWSRKQKDGWTPVKSEKCSKRKFTEPSPYFLTGLIKIKQDGFRMVGSGSLQPNPRQNYRFYRAKRYEGHKGEPVESVRADLVEEEFKSALRHVLKDTTSLDVKIRQFVERRKQELIQRTQNAEPLLRERAELERWYKDTFSVASKRGKQLLNQDAKTVEARLEEIDALLATSGVVVDLTNAEITEIISSVRKQFIALVAASDEAPLDSLRSLAEVFISRLTFDPVERQIDLELALPSWAISKQNEIMRRLRLNEKSDDQSFFCTNSPDRVVLLTMSCEEKRVSYGPCLNCKRRAA